MLRMKANFVSPPVTPNSLHWLGDQPNGDKTGLVAFFEYGADCLTFMDWLTQRDSERRASA